MFNDIAFYGVMISLVTAFTEVLKRAFKIEKDWVPFTSIIVGISWSFCTSLFVYSPEVILIGAVWGISASGLFSNVKPVFEFLAKKLK